MRSREPRRPVDLWPLLALLLVVAAGPWHVVEGKILGTSRWRPGLLLRPSRPNFPTPTNSPDQPSVPEDSRYEVMMGPCLLHIYEPCVNSSRMTFYLLSKMTPDSPIPLNILDHDNITSSGMDPHLATKIIIHGYSGSLFYEPTWEIGKAYLKEESANVIMLDWGAYANMPCYPSAVINTWQAGKCAAQAIYSLAAWSGKPGRFLNRLHLIGFSLGAHIAGFASSYLRPARIGRITGLDPALPFFASLSRSWKLDANDARFVDVIHTNVGVLGKIDHTGHVDFYANGGSVQPFCLSSSRPLCNHLLAATYFAESISGTSRGFWGTPCNSFLYYALGWCNNSTDGVHQSRTAVLMGEHCPRSTRGVYFVTTGQEAPFALGPLLDTTLVLEEPEPVVAEEETPLSQEEYENEQLFQNSSMVLRAWRP